MTVPSDLLVSVVAPVRNRGHEVRALIEALGRQTLPRERFEVVIGDDGSTDGSMDGLATAGGWVRVVTGPPLNSYAARNRAALAARAPVLASCDSDCLPEPGWLEAGLAALETADVVAGLIRCIVPPRPSLWTMLDVDTFLDQERAVRSGYALGGNLFFRRELLDCLGGFDESLPNQGDYDFVSRCVASGARLVFAPEAAVWHPTRSRAMPFLRKVWAVHRRYAEREARAGRLPNGLKLRSWVPIVQPLRGRRRVGRSVRLDRRRLPASGIRPRPWDDLRALPIIYVLIPYLGGVAQARGWLAGRGARGGGRAGSTGAGHMPG